MYFGTEAIQTELEALYDNQFESTLLERQWHEIYYAAESDAGLFDDMTNVKKNAYQLYSFTSSDLKNRLFDAAIAKTTVGVATTQYWAWSDAVNLYYQKYNGQMLDINGNRFRSKYITDEVRKELISLYAIVLQEKVIGAIKQVENGADGYKRFMLERLANGSEKRFVLQALQEDMAFVLPGKENTAENQLKGEVISMLFYLATLFSRNRFNMFQHLGAMYSLYNGGREPKDPLHPDTKDTMFYRIVSLVDEWRAECSKTKTVVNKAVAVEDPF